METDLPGGWRLVEVDEVDSTQAELRRRLATDWHVRWVVRSARQKAGRGRRGRPWGSPEGGLWCSLLLLHGEIADPFCGMLLALAARNAVADSLGSEGRSLALKWPNDLVIGEAKWGGILAEVERDPKGRPIVLLGLGLNLAIDGGQLAGDAEIPPRATSILAQFGRSPSPQEALSRILVHLDTLLEEDSAPGGRNRTRLRVAEVLDTLGRSIRWNDDRGEELTGEAVGLAPDGGLEVRVFDGCVDGSSRRDVLRSAEVTHLRPAEEERS